jgi:hypothetical protein
MRFLMRLVAALALAVGLTWGPGAAPASAHHIQSPLAGFTCAYLREGQSAGHAVISAHIPQMGPGWIKVQCETTNLVIWCSYHGYHNSTLGFSGPFDQFCGDI